MNQKTQQKTASSSRLKDLVPADFNQPTVVFLTSTGHVQKLRHLRTALFYKPNESATESTTQYLVGPKAESFLLRNFFGAKVTETRLSLPADLQALLSIPSFCVTTEKFLKIRKENAKSVKKFYAYELFTEQEMRELFYGLGASRHACHIIHSLRIANKDHLRAKVYVSKRWIRLFATLAAAAGATPLPLPLSLIVKYSSEEMLRRNLFAILLDCFNIDTKNWPELCPFEPEPFSEKAPGSRIPLLTRLTQTATKAALSSLGNKSASLWFKRISHLAPAAAFAGNAGIIYSRVYRAGRKLTQACEEHWAREFESCAPEDMSS